MNDIEDLFAITNEAGIFRYFPTKTPWTVEKTERSIFHQIQHWDKFGYGQMAVTLARNSGQLMGWCGLEFLPETNENEVGYLLSKAFWGKGYATEAARESVEFWVGNNCIERDHRIDRPRRTLLRKRYCRNAGWHSHGVKSSFGMEMIRYAIQLSRAGKIKDRRRLTAVTISGFCQHLESFYFSP